MNPRAAKGHRPNSTHRAIGCLVGTPRRNHSHRAPKEHKIPTNNYTSYHGMMAALKAQRRRLPSPRPVAFCQRVLTSPLSPTMRRRATGPTTHMGGAHQHLAMRAQAPRGKRTASGEQRVVLVVLRPPPCMPPPHHRPLSARCCWCHLGENPPLRDFPRSCR